MSVNFPPISGANVLTGRANRAMIWSVSSALTHRPDYPAVSNKPCFFWPHLWVAVPTGLIPGRSARLKTAPDTWGELFSNRSAALQCATNARQGLTTAERKFYHG